MSVWPRSVQNKRMAFHALGVAIACAGAIACSGGGSPTNPSNPGTGGSSTASCRTFATTRRSVQTFVTGETVTTDTTCTLNAANEAVCQSSFVDSVGGPGTGTQTSRFSSRSDIVDEASVNPPLDRSLGTTTVISTAGLSLTITATNTFDAQKRVVSTVIASPPPIGTITNTFTAFDSSGRPTAGTTTAPGGSSTSFTYDNANRSVTKVIGLNTCTVTHDQNANIIKEVCTGTTASTTNVTVQATQQICK